MVTERVTIVFKADGTRVVRREIRSLDRTSRRASKGVTFLRRALATLVGVDLLRRFIRLTDQFQTLQNRLRVVTDGSQQLVEVTGQLLTISARTRTAVQTNAALFSRLALATRELGTSEAELLQFTESLNQAIIVSGVGAQEASQALIQLSQGLASGTLRGDELRSVLEQLPRVADVIAKQLKVTRGELRELGKDGKITAEVILEGFKAAREELATEFAQTTPTISQGFTVLQNNVLELVGAFEEATGAVAGFAEFLLVSAEAIRELSVQVRALNLGSFIEDLKTLSQFTGLGLIARLSGDVGTLLGEFKRLEEVQREAAAFSRQATEAGGVAALRTQGAPQFEPAAPTERRPDRATLQQAESLNKLTESLRGQNQELRQQQALLMAEGEERDRLSALFDVQNALRKAGAEATAAENLELRNKAVALAQENAEFERRAAIQGTIQAINAETERELELSRLRGTALEREIALRQARDQLVAAGLTQQQAENQLAEQGLATNLRKIQVQRAENQILEELRPSEDERAIQQQALNNLFEQGAISLEEYNQGLRNLQTEAATAGTVFDGFRTRLLQVDTTVQGVGASLANILLSAVNQLSDAIATLIVDGLRDFESFKEALSNILRSLAKEIIKLIIQTLILKAIKASLGEGGGGGGGTLSAAGTGLDVNPATGQALQAGGPVAAGEPVIVGERGPEPFIPTRSGNVIPTSRMQSPEVNLQVVNVRDPDELPAFLDSVEGQQAVLNVLQKNSRQVAQISSGGA